MRCQKLKDMRKSNTHSNTLLNDTDANRNDTRNSNRHTHANCSTDAYYQHQLSPLQLEVVAEEAEGAAPAAKNV